MLTPLGVSFIGCMCIGVWRCLGIAIEQVSHLSFCKVSQKENYYGIQNFKIFWCTNSRERVYLFSSTFSLVLYDRFN